jgi:hypothetical protein
MNEASLSKTPQHRKKVQQKSLRQRWEFEKGRDMRERESEHQFLLLHSLHVLRQSAGRLLAILLLRHHVRHLHTTTAPANSTPQQPCTHLTKTLCLRRERERGED